MRIAGHSYPAAFILLALAGCATPVHVANWQQMWIGMTRGEVRELLDENGKAIAGFSGRKAKKHKGVHELRLMPQWKSGGDLSRLKGKTVKLRFTLQNAKLYAFDFN